MYAAGAAVGVDKAYKCRVRKPWWRVPVVPAPDLFVTYMNHDTPRLVADRAGTLYLNSVHGLKLRSGRKQLGMDLLPIGALNSFTVLGAEMVGRAYGGGILKLEPKEADLLPVPSFKTLEAAGPQLRALRPQLASFLRSGKWEEAVTMVDRVLLVDGLGMDRVTVKALREARHALFLRRTGRGD